MEKIIYSQYYNNLTNKADPFTSFAPSLIEKQKQYAKKCGAEYICYTISEPLTYNQTQFSKLHRLNDFGNAKIVYMDLDVIPNEDAPNIFDSNYQFAMLPMFRSNCFKSKQKNLALGYYGDDIILNTGVVATTSEFVQNLDLENRIKEFTSLFDDANNEAFMSWMVEKYDVDYQPLPICWNWIIDKGQRVQTDKAYFIHYSSKNFLPLFPKD